jgi:hypothetical protein
MSQDNKPSTGVSPEMDEVLNDMAEEGVDLSNQDEEQKAPESSEQEDQSGDEDETGSESEETEEESDEEESEESDEESEETEEAEDDSEESEEGDESEEEVEAPSGKSVPVGKLNYWKNKAKKALDDLKKLKDTSSHQEVDEKLKQISEQEGIPMDRLKVLVDTISDKILSPELKKKIDLAARQQEKVAFEEEQNDAFMRDFDATVKPLILNENPDITQEEFNKKLNQIYSEAFKPTKENTIDPKLGRAPKSLVDIYLSSRKAPSRFGGERTKIRSMAGAGRQLEDITSPEDVWNLPDKDFEKAFADGKSSSPRMIGKKMTK